MQGGGCRVSIQIEQYNHQDAAVQVNMAQKAVKEPPDLSLKHSARSRATFGNMVNGNWQRLQSSNNAIMSPKQQF
jgi:hypothetical protein